MIPGLATPRGADSGLKALTMLRAMAQKRPVRWPWLRSQSRQRQPRTLQPQRRIGHPPMNRPRHQSLTSQPWSDSQRPRQPRGVRGVTEFEGGAPRLGRAALPPFRPQEFEGPPMGLGRNSRTLESAPPRGS